MNVEEMSPELRDAVKAGVMVGCCPFHCTSKSCDCHNHTCKHLIDSANKASEEIKNERKNPNKK